MKEELLALLLSVCASCYGEARETLKVVKPPSFVRDSRPIPRAVQTALS